MKNIILLLFGLFLFSCKSTNEILYNKSLKKLSTNHFQKMINWQHLDLQKDSVIGLSLNKAYDEIIKKNKGEEVIVAVLDSYIDIKHPSIKENIWINKKEIPNNSIDDDNNGYIDDLHGWNFMGNSNGNSTAFLNSDATRIRRKLIQKYSKDTVSFIGNKQDSILFHKANNLLSKAKKKYFSRKEDEKYYKDMLSKAFITLKSIFPKEKYTTKQLDSIYNYYEKKDTTIAYQAFFVKEILNIGCTNEWFELYYQGIEKEAKTTLNPNYYDRSIVGDNEDNLEDNKYGNPDISAYNKIYPHSTYVSATIAGNRKIKKGVHGISDKIKIMPISILPFKGIMTDKDIYYAITYAVNNGAKVINMSFGKYNPIHPEWIKKAILYAEEKDVLLVVSAGNSKENLDTISQYPNDYDNYQGEEFSNNLIMVAGSNKKKSKTIVLDISNYGKKNVDIFAPAEEIVTIDPVCGVHIASGTTYAAALTSGVAALIRSQYPELTATQVKQILMDSSVKFDLMVQVPGEKEGTLKHFSELSKSGGVLNAYNALLMAEELSKKREAKNNLKTITVLNKE